MSDEKKPGFFQTDNDFIDSGCFAALVKYSKPAAIVFQILLRFRNNKTNMAFPSMEDLIELSGMYRQTIAKATDVLHKFHLIEKKRAGKRFKYHNFYKIIKHDRKGYEMIARTCSTALNECKPKRVRSTALIEGNKKYWAEKRRISSTALNECKKPGCVGSMALNSRIGSTALNDKDLKRLEKTIKKEKNNVSLSINKVKRDKTKIKITPKKLSAEFDKTKDAGEKAFKTFAEEIQTKSKTKSAKQKTIEGKTL